jgi:hypothetical protein
MHRAMVLLRRATLLLICLVPMLTLFHRNETGLWVRNTSAFISPDEFSYLLTAENIAAGRGIVLRNLPADSFYPPGLSALLALWGKWFGFSIFSMHVCIVAQQCVAVALAYLLIGAMLARPRPMFLHAWIPLLLTAVYATSWYLLENACSIFGEPAFTCVTLLWLLIALRKPRWWQQPRWAFAMAALAVAATSIRSAGIICVAVTFLFPLVDWLLHARRERPRAFSRLLAALGICAAVTLAYYAVIQTIAPQKGVATTSGNSYTRQLLRGLTDDDRIPYYNLPALAENLAKICIPHFYTFAQLFCPPPREDAAFNIPRMGVYNVLARCLLALALAGWLFDLLARRPNRSMFIPMYICFYVGLYSIWPFDFVRFWVPIFPPLLAYMWETIAAGPRRGTKLPRIAQPLGTAMCLLLVLLNAQEIFFQLPYYQRRLNYVSDCLAGAASAIQKDGGDPRRDIVASGDPFLYAYYTRFPQSVLPPPDPPSRGPDICHTETLFIQQSVADALSKSSHMRIYLPAYFPPDFYPRLTADIAAALPPAYQIRQIYKQEMVTLWVVKPR